MFGFNGATVPDYKYELSFISEPPRVESGSLYSAGNSPPPPPVDLSLKPYDFCAFGLYDY